MSPHRILLSAAAAATTWLAGCATPMPIQGETRLDPGKRGGVTANLISISRRATDCPQVDAITARVDRVNAPVPGHPNETTRLGSVSEIWTVSLCGQQMPWQVIHAPDGRGGTFVMVGAAPR